MPSKLPRPAPLFMLLGALAGLALIPSSADATTYTVTTTEDLLGTCPTADNCGLRQAIISADSDPAADTINLPAGYYGLSAGPLVVLNTDLTITGAGSADTVINGGGASLVLALVTANTINLSGLAITGGGNSFNGAGFFATGGTANLSKVAIYGNHSGTPATAGAGAGILSVASNTTVTDSTVTGNVATGTVSGGTGAGVVAVSGGSLKVSSSVIRGNVAGPGTTGGGTAGGLYSQASTTIENSTIADNSALGAPSGSPGNGAGVLLMAGASITNSTIAGNLASGGAGPNGAAGGGLFVIGVDPVTVTNSTIANNRATAGGASQAVGGGIMSVATADVNLVNVTVANNLAGGLTGMGGNIFAVAGPIKPTNTVIAGGSAASSSNCGIVGGGSVVPAGRNLESADTCSLGAGDLKNADPKLGALADNGGATKTMALLSGSPAFDAGLGCPPPATDQRGVARPQGAACDIGAYEVPVDSAPPHLTGLKLSSGKFRSRGKSSSAPKSKKKRAPLGATISFLLSEPGSVNFTVRRATKGTKKGGACGPRKRKGKRCTRYVDLKGSFTANGVAGANSYKFKGQLGGKKLGTGNYKLVATPTDAAGNKGTPALKSFTVVK